MQSKIHLSVAQLPQLLPSEWLARDQATRDMNLPIIAVVIDTLRFTSTACVALQAGAASICVAAEVEAARNLARNLGDGTLLCGERHCHRIEGFQLGNSPFEYDPATVANHNLVFSTTNGTRAVDAASGADQVVLASLLNRAAVVQWICASRFSRIWIVCAGTDGQIAAEDVLTAGAIVSGCQDCSDSCELKNDSAVIAFELFNSLRDRVGTVSENAILRVLMETAGGQNLIQAGYNQDITAVARLDSIGVVPRSQDSQAMKFGLN